MKTVEEKARALLDETCVSGAAFNRLLRAITLALKEQDRDTRHACAEAVVSLEGCTTSNDNAIYGPHGEICKAVSVDEAQAACMNVRAF